MLFAAEDVNAATSSLQRAEFACYPPTAALPAPHPCTGAAAALRLEGRPEPQLLDAGRRGQPAEQQHAPAAQRRGVRKRRFRRAAGKSAFARDIEVWGRLLTFSRHAVCSPCHVSHGKSQTGSSTHVTGALRCSQLFRLRVEWEAADAEVH